jgi:hypothetical protein
VNKAGAGTNEVLDARETWNLGFQTITTVDFKIQPGDQLNTHCVYDTTKVTKPVAFGKNSDDEMCMHFLGYYPAQSQARNW